MILNNASNLMVGSNQVQSVYLGSSLVWSGSVLPVGYEKLDYIESSGHQLILTGINSGDLTINTKIITSIQFIGNGTRQLIGADYGCYFGVSNNGKFEIGPAYVTQYPGTDSFHTVEFKQNKTAGEITISIDGNTPTKRTGFNSWRDYEIYIFSLNSGYPNFSYAPYARIKSFEIYHNDELVSKLIPAIFSNGNPCFYDSVSGSTLYNRMDGTLGYKKLDGTIVAPT